MINYRGHLSFDQIVQLLFVPMKVHVNESSMANIYHLQRSQTLWEFT